MPITANVSDDLRAIMNARALPQSSAGSSSGYGASSSTSGFAPDYDYQFRIRLAGDQGAGKSSLLLRYADDLFTGSYISSLGVDFKTRTIQMAGRTTRLQIWDVVGQERFRPIHGGHHNRGAHAVMLCFDFTDTLSFQHVRQWLREIERYAGATVPVVIVGNKLDLVSSAENAVSFETFQAFCEDVGHPGVATSSRDNMNVDLAFEIATASALSRALLPEQMEQIRAQQRASLAQAPAPAKTSESGFFSTILRKMGIKNPSETPPPPSSSNKRG